MDLIEIINHAKVWLTPEVLTQAGAVLSSFLLSIYCSNKIKTWIFNRLEESKLKLNHLLRIKRTAKALVFPLVNLVVFWSCLGLGFAAGWNLPIVEIIANLTIAWVVARTVTQLIKNPALAKTISFLVWTGIALHLLNWLDPAILFLETAAIAPGGLNISALTILKGLFWIVLLLWATSGISNLIESKLHQSQNITPALKILIGKFLKIGLSIVVIVIVITTLGFDLTVFAVFGGALGIGIGLGLQKLISNLLSGILILLDRSIKPGDVISINDTYGWVHSLGSRYVAVVTRDGTEHLIPNEDMITQRVENWTHSDSNVRLRIPVGVHYDSDVEKAMALCVEAAADEDRILEHPLPKCRLKGFGDNSVDLEIRAWISDPQHGITNIKSLILLNLWHKFKACT